MTSTQRHRTRRGPAPLPDGTARRGQGGMSLVEVLLAVTLMSTVLLGIAAGFQTTTKLSGDAGARASLQAALNSTVDRVTTLDYPYCDTPAQITTKANAVGVAPAGYSATVVGVTYLVPVAPCVAGNTGTSAVLLRVTVTDNVDPTRTMTGETVLRNPAARPS